MIKSYLLVAWRNFLRNKHYTAINIVCLALGITGAVFISLLLNHEFSFDRHHENHRNIFRLHGIYTISGDTDYISITPTPLGPAMKLEFSGIKNYVRFQSISTADVRIGDRQFLKNDFYFADSTIFDVFTHKFVYGQPQGALSRHNSVVLTQSLSNHLLGSINPIGKEILINFEPYMVTAVIEDLPQASHLQFVALLSIAGLPDAYTIHSSQFWSIPHNYTYIELHDTTDVHSVMNNMADFHQKYTEPSGVQFSATAIFTATPLTETRFKQIIFSPPTINKNTLYVLLAVAIFLILIATVNYTNLATARAGVRAREIGVRKAIGATSAELRWQFLMESILLAFLAMLASFLIMEVLLPGFNNLADKEFTINDVFSLHIIWQVLAITIITGLLAGTYPAFLLSRMEPALILKNIKQKPTGPKTLRKGLVIFQFAISIILVSATLTLQKQLHFLFEKDLGLSLENRLSLSLEGRLNNEQLEELEEMLTQNPAIVNPTKSFAIPGSGYNSIAILYETNSGFREGKIALNIADKNYLDFFDMELSDGKNFNDIHEDERPGKAIINESAVKFLGWQEGAIGKQIHWQFTEGFEAEQHLVVLGVMKDHHFLNLESKVNPIMIQYADWDEPFGYLSLEVKDGKIAEAENFIRQTLMASFPSYQTNIIKPADHYINSFNYERRLGTIFGIFAILCILLSFLGLLGLASFLSEQRKTETGIRKVLGASAQDILLLYYLEYAILIAIAIMIAAPVSWIILDQWLNVFIYRIPMSGTPLIIASLLAVWVAFITVGYHTIRSTLANPIDAIRAD